MHIFIMAGGQGTRFWPESTAKRPKQYLNFLGGESLLKTTYKRVLPLSSEENISVITVDEQVPLVKESLEHISLIIEPMGKNTAPCLLLALATLLSKRINKDEVMAIVPSDHIILDTAGFQQSMTMAGEIAKNRKKIVTIGIRPHFPHTGFGYIKTAKEISPSFAYEVESFKEKPNFETATSYLKDGGYFWNAGIFVATIETLIGELRKLAPYYYERLDELTKAIGNQEAVTKIYSELKPDSIDYALMEKSQEVALVKGQFDWNDLGSWDALADIIPMENDNTNVQTKELKHIGAKNNIVYAPNQRVALVNIEELIIVSTKDTLMILPKKDAQKVKDISLKF